MQSYLSLVSLSQNYFRRREYNLACGNFQSVEQVGEHVSPALTALPCIVSLLRNHHPARGREGGCRKGKTISDVPLFLAATSIAALGAAYRRLTHLTTTSSQ